MHPLRGKLDGLHSVSINLSYRITLELLIQDGQIIPVNVGDYDAVHYWLAKALCYEQESRCAHHRRNRD